MLYACNFIDFSDVQSFVVSEKIEDFKEGFWLNRTFEFTTGDDAHYWIPPGRITYVEKVKENSDSLYTSNDNKI